MSVGVGEPEIRASEGRSLVQQFLSRLIQEGISTGYVALSDENGELIGEGISQQVALGDKITNELAPLIGKKPPNTDIWVMEGRAPAFAASKGPLYAGGPVWRISLISPVLAQ